MDLKWPKMPLKVNFGHPIWAIDQKLPEMQSKVIFGHPKWPPKKTVKFCINLKWPELLSISKKKNISGILYFLCELGQIMTRYDFQEAR